MTGQASTTPWALGTFVGGGREFAGLVVGEQVHALGDVAGLARPGVRELLEHWAYARPELARLAAGGGDPQRVRRRGRMTVTTVDTDLLALPVEDAIAEAARRYSNQGAVGSPVNPLAVF